MPVNYQWPQNNPMQNDSTAKRRTHLIGPPLNVFIFFISLTDTKKIEMTNDYFPLIIKTDELNGMN
jgi:hypothetical protein